MLITLFHHHGIKNKLRPLVKNLLKIYQQTLMLLLVVPYISIQNGLSESHCKQLSLLTRQLAFWLAVYLLAWVAGCQFETLLGFSSFTHGPNPHTDQNWPVRLCVFPCVLDVGWWWKPVWRAGSCAPGCHLPRRPGLLHEEDLQLAPGQTKLNEGFPKQTELPLPLPKSCTRSSSVCFRFAVCWSLDRNWSILDVFQCDTNYYALVVSWLRAYQNSS